MTGLTKRIDEYLNELIPNPKCELNYTKDYELLIATMLSAQTTDKRVNLVTDVLFTKYPSLKDFSLANLDDVKKIIKPIGTYNVKAINLVKLTKKLYDDYPERLPNDRDYLESLPGVGRKTTNVVLSNIFNEPFIAVDTHVNRVSKRLGLAKEEDDVYKVEMKLNKLFKKSDLCKKHHQLVLFGRYYCKARNPFCDDCKLKDICKYKKG